MEISRDLGAVFDWWIEKPSSSQVYRSLVRPLFKHEIFTDASLSGWGASMSDQRTHGWWSEEEKLEHINFLELKAVDYALRCFAADISSVDIVLHIDDTTALAYINKIGFIKFPKLSTLAKPIWQWYESRDLHLYASHIKSSDNLVADSESCFTSVETEWELSLNAFSQIQHKLGSFEIDRFATNINAKCDPFVSWFPDPYAYTVDVLTMDWKHLQFYAFPPFVVITRVLRKVLNEKAEGFVVVLWWPAQPWFPLFNKLLISPLVKFDPALHLLSSPFSKKYPVWAQHDVDVIGRAFRGFDGWDSARGGWVPDIRHFSKILRQTTHSVGKFGWSIDFKSSKTAGNFFSLSWSKSETMACIL